MVLLLLSGCNAQDRPDAETVIGVPPPAAAPIDPAPTPHVLAKAEPVTADELYTVYSQNIIINANADQRFLDHVLLTTGVFNGINRGLPGKTYMELRTHDPDAFVYAELSPQAQPLLATLTPGASVRMYCVGDGMVGGSPRLRSCRNA